MSNRVVIPKIPLEAVRIYNDHAHAFPNACPNA